VCVGILYSGEYDVCDLTLCVHCHTGRAESLPVHGGYRTRNLCQILKNSLIIQEENTKKNHKRVVSLYVIKNNVNLHKL
jgi:hypothetical protein